MASIIVVAASGKGLGELAQQYLASRGHQVTIVSDGVTALQTVASLRVDALIFAGEDRQPDQFRRWLRADPERKSLPVLWVVGAHNPTPLLEMQAGVDWLLRRPFSVAELGETVRRLLEENPGLGGGSRYGWVADLALDQELRQLRGTKGWVPLTPIEFRLLSYLSQRPGRVVSVEELLERVWHFHPGTGSPEVVRTHIRNLRAKVGAAGSAREVIQTLPRRGYRLVPGPGD